MLFRIAAHIQGGVAVAAQPFHFRLQTTAGFDEQGQKCIRIKFFQPFEFFMTRWIGLWRAIKFTENKAGGEGIGISNAPFQDSSLY